MTPSFALPVLHPAHISAYIGLQLGGGYQGEGGRRPAKLSLPPGERAFRYWAAKTTFTVKTTYLFIFITSRMHPKLSSWVFQVLGCGFKSSSRFRIRVRHSIYHCTHEGVHASFYFILLFFPCCFVCLFVFCTHGMQTFPDQVLNSCHSTDLSHCSNNTRSLTC